MGGVVDAIVDAVSGIIDAIVDVVKTIWNDIVVPILEGVLAIFGIEDETIVSVQKVSIAVLSENPENLVKSGLTNTVLSMGNNGAGFYKNYIVNFNKHKGQISNFYNYANKGPYVYGLPNMVVRGNELDFSAVDSAINTDLSGSYAVLTADTTYPTPEVWFKHLYQNNGYDYKPYTNKLTKTASNGVSYDDWEFIDVSFNTVSMGYDVTVRRLAETTNYWVTSSSLYGYEGDTVTLTVHVNRAVPVGETFTVNLSYSGASGSEFDAPTSVVLNAGDTSATVDIDNISVSTSKNLNVTISTSATTAYEFLEVVDSKSTLSVVLIPAANISLCIGTVAVQEGNTASIPVTLSGNASGPFSVNWATSDSSSAVAGDDYTASSGVLNFSGTSGEVKNISVNTTIDSVVDTFEYFNIVLSGVSIAGVDTTNGRVLITESAVSPPSSGTGYITEVLSESNYAKDRHLVVTYHEDSETPTEWYYWLYNLTSGTYPGIDPKSGSISNLDMLPVAIIRKNKQFVDQDKDIPNDLYEDFGKSTDVYKTTRNILNKVNLRIDDLIENVNDNPDIDLVDDVYVNFSMNPADSNKVLSKLLWLHWYEIIVVNGITSNTNEYSATFTEQDVNNALVWSDHSHTGNLLISSLPYVPGLASKIGGTKVNHYTHKVYNDDLYVVKKISDTHVDYIKINDLSGMSAIAYDGFHNVAFNKVGDDNFTMPISWYLMRKLRGPEVIELFPYIFRLDVYSIQVTELAWYQTGAFKTLFYIVMVIITIYTLGTATSYWVALGEMLFNYAVVQIIVYIAELTGNAELAAAIGIIASVVIGSYNGTSFDITSAEGLTNVVTTFATNLGAAQSGELKALSEDLTDLLEEFEKQKELIKEHDTSSGSLSGLEYWSIKSVDTLMYESMDIQFNFDLLYDYDSLTTGYFEQQLIVSQV